MYHLFVTLKKCLHSKFCIVFYYLINRPSFYPFVRFDLIATKYRWSDWFFIVNTQWNAKGGEKKSNKKIIKSQLSNISGSKVSFTRTYPQNCPKHWQSPDRQGSSREQWRKGAWPQEERGARCERHVTTECGWRVRRRRGPESGQRTTWSAGRLTVDLRILSIAQVRKNWREMTFSLDLGSLT